MIDIKKLEDERIGTINFNKYRSKMTVVKYESVKDIWVQFEKGNIVHTQWTPFIKGDVQNVYDKSLCNIGYIGQGNYHVRINNEITKQYKVWSAMLNRCYNKKYNETQPTYKDVTVCEEWLNFQNFALWYDQNYYEVNGEKMQLDKDILIKGNKTYSPETCVFVPQRINALFTNRKNCRGKLPIGVVFHKKHKYFTTKCGDSKGGTIHLGNYQTPEEAFYVYKEYKEKLIKQVAEEYKGKVPQKLYNAMYDYIVEITD